MKITFFQSTKNKKVIVSTDADSQIKWIFTDVYSALETYKFVKHLKVCSVEWQKP